MDAKHGDTSCTYSYLRIIGVARFVWIRKVFMSFMWWCFVHVCEM